MVTYTMVAMVGPRKLHVNIAPAKIIPTCTSDMEEIGCFAASIFTTMYKPTCIIVDNDIYLEEKKITKEYILVYL